MASIVLIFSHPSLGHPKTTVQTCFASQSRNLWNVCGHSPRIFGLERLFWVCVQYRGQRGVSEEPPCDFFSGSVRGRARRHSAPDGDRPASSVTGGRAPLALEGTALAYLFRALLLRHSAWGVGTAVPLCPDWMGRFTCEINARVRRA